MFGSTSPLLVSTTSEGPFGEGAPLELSNAQAVDSFWQAVAAEAVGGLIVVAVIYVLGAITGAFGISILILVLSILVIVAALVLFAFAGAGRLMDSL